jgi:hypothetical protein
MQQGSCPLRLHYHSVLQRTMMFSVAVQYTQYTVFNTPQRVALQAIFTAYRQDGKVQGPTTSYDNIPWTPPIRR